MRKIIISLLICTSLILACSKDEVSGDPQDTITLNMYDESNGKTLLGFSDVYINNANNFKCSSSAINGYGAMSGLGVNVSLNLTSSNLVKEIAVKEGHLYQIYSTNSLVQFPSGEYAIGPDDIYYKMFVSSVITEEDEIIGAEVKYIGKKANLDKLPEFNYHIGTLYNIGDVVEIEISSNIEWLLERDYEVDNFDIKMENGKLKITLNSIPDKTYGPYGDYRLYIRLGSVYTMIHFFVEV